MSAFAQYGSETAATPRHGRVRQERATEADFRSGTPLRWPSDTPEVFCPARCSSSNRLPSKFRVLSAVTTVFGSGIACRRTSRFGVRQPPVAERNPRTNQVADDNESGGDADTGLQWSTGLPPAHRVDQVQPCPLGVVLMGLRIAEVDEHSPMYLATKPPKRFTVSATHFW
jgi:hypothetical protein